MDDVSQVLRRFSPEFRLARVEPLGAAQGMSGAQFWRVTARCGPHILRRWPREHPTPERLRFIHTVLRYASGRGCSVIPVPIVATNGESFVPFAGHLWELAPWMPGGADFEYAPSMAKLQAALRSIAQFHLAVADYTEAGRIRPNVGSAPAIVTRITRLRELAFGGSQRLGRAIDTSRCPELALPARQFLAGLPVVLPRALALLEPLAATQLPLQPCLRDIWHDHVLFTGDEVTGIVDFGALDIDTPATDISRLLGSLASVTPLRFAEGQAEGHVGLHVWQLGLDAYASVRSLSLAEWQAVEALDLSGLVLAGCNWIDWIYVDRRRFENLSQVVGRFERIMARVREVRP